MWPPHPIDLYLSPHRIKQKLAASLDAIYDVEATSCKWKWFQGEIRFQ